MKHEGQIMKNVILLLSVILCGACAGLGSHRAEDLRVTRAVLYQNGIGYFERQGKVHGKTITLRVLPQQIADVLKSLTVVDLGSGRALNVVLPVEKGAAQQLAALPPQVRDAGGLMSIAQAFRGARVTVNATDTSTSGRLVGVEPLSEEKAEWRITVLREDGALESIDALKITSLQLEDRTLEVGLRKALDISLDEGSWKPVEVTVHLSGPAPHDVVMSYVVEMPTWKPAYRVVLNKDEPQGLLQGWAVVDNVSGEDWNDVMLALTAGTPLTFTYDLYRPRHVQRPDLTPEDEMAAAPPPPIGGMASPLAMDSPKPMKEKEISSSDDEDLEEEEAKGGLEYEKSEKKSKRKMPTPSAPPATQAPMKAMRNRSGGFGGKSSEVDAALLENEFRAIVGGTRVGSLFRYDIDEPISIKDRHSALVSLLNQKVPAKEVLLFRMDAATQHPYRAVHLTNSTNYMIEKGPVAIYKNNSFVGEALINQVETSTSTFIPYSMDGRFIITLEDQLRDEQAKLVKIAEGQIQTEAKQVTVARYTIHNQSGEAASLYIQRPHRPGWKLVQPKEGALIEKQHSFVPVNVSTEKKTEFEVREETPVRRWVSIYSPEGQHAIALYLNDPSADPNASKALREALALQEQLAKLEAELQRLRREKDTFAERQTQVRENLKLLGKSISNADLAKKLSTTLLELEGKLNEVTRNIVAKDIKRSELRDRLTVLFKAVTLDGK